MIPGLGKLPSDLTKQIVLESTSRFVRGSGVQKKFQRRSPKQESAMFTHISRKKLNDRSVQHRKSQEKKRSASKSGSKKSGGNAPRFKRERSHSIHSSKSKSDKSSNKSSRENRKSIGPGQNMINHQVNPLQNRSSYSKVPNTTGSVNKSKSNNPLAALITGQGNKPTSPKMNRTNQGISQHSQNLRPAAEKNIANRNQLQPHKRTHDLKADDLMDDIFGTKQARLISRSKSKNSKSSNKSIRVDSPKQTKIQRNSYTANSPKFKGPQAKEEKPLQPKIIPKKELQNSQKPVNTNRSPNTEDGSRFARRNETQESNRRTLNQRPEVTSPRALPAPVQNKNIQKPEVKKTIEIQQKQELQHLEDLQKKEKERQQELLEKYTRKPQNTQKSSTDNRFRGNQIEPKDRTLTSPRSNNSTANLNNNLGTSRTNRTQQSSQEKAPISREKSPRSNANQSSRATINKVEPQPPANRYGANRSIQNQQVSPRGVQPQIAKKPEELQPAMNRYGGNRSAQMKEVSPKQITPANTSQQRGQPSSNIDRSIVSPAQKNRPQPRNVAPKSPEPLISEQQKQQQELLNKYSRKKPDIQKKDDSIAPTSQPTRNNLRSQTQIAQQTQIRPKYPSNEKDMSSSNVSNRFKSNIPAKEVQEKKPVPKSPETKPSMDLAELQEKQRQRQEQLLAKYSRKPASSNTQTHQRQQSQNRFNRGNTNQNKPQVSPRQNAYKKSPEIDNKISRAEPKSTIRSPQRQIPQPQKVEPIRNSRQPVPATQIPKRPQPQRNIKQEQPTSPQTRQINNYTSPAQQPERNNLRQVPNKEPPQRITRQEKPESPQTKPVNRYTSPRQPNQSTTIRPIAPKTQVQKPEPQINRYTSPSGNQQKPIAPQARGPVTPVNKQESERPLNRYGAQRKEPIINQNRKEPETVARNISPRQQTQPITRPQTKVTPQPEPVRPQPVRPEPQRKETKPLTSKEQDKKQGECQPQKNITFFTLSLVNILKGKLSENLNIIRKSDAGKVKNISKNIFAYGLASKLLNSINSTTQQAFHHIKIYSVNNLFSGKLQKKSEELNEKLSKLAELEEKYKSNLTETPQAQRVMSEQKKLIFSIGFKAIERLIFDQKKHVFEKLHKKTENNKKKAILLASILASIKKASEYRAKSSVFYQLKSKTFESGGASFPMKQSPIRNTRQVTPPPTRSQTVMKQPVDRSKLQKLEAELRNKRSKYTSQLDDLNYRIEELKQLNNEKRYQVESKEEEKTKLQAIISNNKFSPLEFDPYVEEEPPLDSFPRFQQLSTFYYKLFYESQPKQVVDVSLLSSSITTDTQTDSVCQQWILTHENSRLLKIIQVFQQGQSTDIPSNARVKVISENQVAKECVQSYVKQSYLWNFVRSFVKMKGH